VSGQNTAVAIDRDVERQVMSAKLQPQGVFSKGAPRKEM
jgi:hypothetical protein